MIFCEIKNDKNDSDACAFKLEVDGKGVDLLYELMRINAELILLMRKVGIPDESIEKQLANNICGGFKIAEDIEKQRRASK